MQHPEWMAWEKYKGIRKHLSSILLTLLGWKVIFSSRVE